MIRSYIASLYFSLNYWKILPDLQKQDLLLQNCSCELFDSTILPPTKKSWVKFLKIITKFTHTHKKTKKYFWQFVRIHYLNKCHTSKTRKLFLISYIWYIEQKMLRKQQFFAEILMLLESGPKNYSTSFIANYLTLYD